MKVELIDRKLNHPFQDFPLRAISYITLGAKGSHMAIFKSIKGKVNTRRRRHRNKGNHNRMKFHGKPEPHNASLLETIMFLEVIDIAKL